MSDDTMIKDVRVIITDLVSAAMASLWLGAPGHVSNRDPDSNPEKRDP